MKVLNLNGLFETYINSIVLEQDSSANFSLLKKETVDVSEIRQHLLKISQIRQENDFEKLYTNLYSTHIITREWRGHNDYITHLEFLEDPISTITISKDKYLHIWDENFELIGEINIFADELNSNLDKNIKEKRIWNFKVNEKKLLEKEVAEFVRILENIEINEETKIFKGSQIDKDFNDPEKYEIDEKEGLIPKREKIIIEEEDKTLNQPIYVIKNNPNVNEAKEENDFQLNYEAIMLKNIAYQIDFLIKNPPSSEGMGELSNSLMNSLIERKTKMDKLKKLRINDFNKLSRPKEIFEPINEIKRDSVFSNKKQEKNNTKSNLIPAYQDEQTLLKDKISLKYEKPMSNPLAISVKKNKSKITLKEKSDIDILNNKTMYRSLFKGKSMDLFKKIKPEVKPLSKTTKSLLGNKFRKTFSDINIFKGNKNKNNNLLHKTILSLNRNNLYAEKFAYKSFYNPEEKEGLPKINSTLLNRKMNFGKFKNNINFESRKKTDDIIKTQYYFNNYKNCVKINPNYSDFSSNKSNMFNYKNMWSDIKSFTRDFISREHKNKKTINFNKPKNLYKSRSTFDIKSS